MLPIILQHVRELAEAHSAGPERDQYKIITPFPPNGQDFPEFTEEALAFGDPPPDGEEASLDTLRAYDFFKRTDSLYYDFSYGIKSENYLLSLLCEQFFLNAQKQTSDAVFGTSFDEKRDAFLNRYRRSTAGDLGRLEFRYTAPSPVSWNAEQVVLNASEVDRLKAKAIAVYEDLDASSVGFIGALIDEVKSSNYASIAYDFGFFDVIREWMDPRLFESPGWATSSGSRVLYGESDPTFAGSDVKLCYAQRFYLIRKYAATPRVAVQAPAPIDRDHRAASTRPSELQQPRTVIVRDHRAASARPPEYQQPRAVTVRDHRAASASPPEVQLTASAVVDPRRNTRNALIREIVEAIKPVTVSADVPPAKAGYVWIPATTTVSAHWERARAGAPPEPTAEAPTGKPSYRIAAVKCRVLSPTSA